MKGSWRGNAVLRGLAADLGEDVAERLQEIADEAVEEADSDITFDPPEDRNNALAFLSLCIAGAMKEES